MSRANHKVLQSAQVQVLRPWFEFPRTTSSVGDVAQLRVLSIEVLRTMETFRAHLRLVTQRRHHNLLNVTQNRAASVFASYNYKQRSTSLMWDQLRCYPLCLGGIQGLIVFLMCTVFSKRICFTNGAQAALIVRLSKETPFRYTDIRGWFHYIEQLRFSSGCIISRYNHTGKSRPRNIVNIYKSDLGCSSSSSNSNHGVVVYPDWLKGGSAIIIIHSRISSHSQLDDDIY